MGSHLPEWFKSLLPRSALIAKEEAWNAYPYTKTRYTCPCVEKFSIEIETHYFPDNGYQENVFNLSGSDLRNRIVGVYLRLYEFPRAFYGLSFLIMIQQY